MTSFNTDAHIGYLVSEVSKVFRRRFEEVAKRHDLTLPQWRVLKELSLEDGLSQVALATAIDADPMTLSGILDRLEKRGLVRREQAPNDNRAKIVRLTADGKDVFNTARALGTEIYELAVQGMSPAQLKATADGLIRIRNNLNGLVAGQKELA